MPTDLTPEQREARKTPKTYADVCRMECPDGCGSDGHKPVVSLNGTPHHILYESRTDGISTRQWIAGYLPCTAPKPEALIERLLAEAAAKEICICAAIRMPDGEVIRGHRHDACYTVVRNRPVHSADPAVIEASRMEIVKAEQGFVTSRNRFVGREEAMEIQKRAGCKSALYGELRGDILFSEDLY